MTTPRHEITLAGCNPEPLASYLKALGILRLVARQADPEARGRWSGESFHLTSTLDEDALIRFFLDRYEPTPLLAPWNGGSGFFYKWDFAKNTFKSRDACERLESVARSERPAFAAYRRAIATVAADLWRRSEPFDPSSAGKEAADEKLLLKGEDGACKALDRADKVEFLIDLRNSQPDDVLAWLDATFAIEESDRRSFPLLGSGGNDGNLDFSSAFLERLVTLIPEDGAIPIPRVTEDLLRDALFRKGEPALRRNPPGQFDPGSWGGANGAEGPIGGSLANDWDYVLMMEGAILFTASIARRMGMASGGRASFPFTVYASPVGCGTVSESDARTARAEIWLPLWPRPASLGEVEHLLGEGRAQVGRRQAANGIDFARAASGLGVDRGIDGFQRYAFVQRNGRMFIAAPLGRVSVRTNPRVRLLDEIDDWLGAVNGLVGSEAPAGARAAARRLGEAIFRYCTTAGRTKLTDVLAAIGAAERAIARSPKAREAVGRPLHGLTEAWIDAADDGSVEFRLAAAVASIRGVRRHLEPVVTGRGSGRPSWGDGGDPDVVWGSGAIETNLGRILERRLIALARADAARTSGDGSGGLVPIDSATQVPLSDVAAFLAGGVDDDRLQDLLFALASIDWPARMPPRLDRGRGPKPRPPAVYALLKLTFLPRPLRLGEREREAGGPGDEEETSIAIPCEAGVTHALRARRVALATALATRRLRAAGLPVPAVIAANPEDLDSSGAPAHRILGSLLIPIFETKSLAAELVRIGRQTDEADPEEADAEMVEVEAKEET